MAFGVRCLLTAGVLATVLGVSALPAHADTTTTAPACTPADQAQITAVLNADGHEATFTVGNADPLCEPMPIGLAVYLKDADGFVVPQSLADSATDTITMGTKVLSITLPTEGTRPQCFTQIDAFTGSVLPEVSDTAQYGARLLAFKWGTVALCAEVEAESSTTSTSTSTTTTIHTDDTQPPQVEGTQITNNAPAVQGQPLARTGPATDISLLVVAAGLLMVVGGLLLASANRPAH